MEYKDHKCLGYNLAGYFYNNEESIMTGSEDGSVYIYNKLGGYLEKKI